MSAGRSGTEPQRIEANRANADKKGMRGVLVAAILVFALMIAIKDGRLMRKAGLTGGCTVLAAQAGDAGTWQACTPGKLQGAPDLTRQSCTSVKKVGKTEYWHCPAGLESKHA
jgi:hypothetical protein